MFTGIVEAAGIVEEVHSNAGNRDFMIRSAISAHLKVDQSVSHNGVCLTVTEIHDGAHRVTAVGETLRRSNLGDWKAGTIVNLERCLQSNGRFDGHVVQGHVDATGTIMAVNDQNGSWELQIAHKPQAGITVPKGSIAVNGVSLTVVDSAPGRFSVVIIPYTWEHTNLCELKPDDSVNLEFDILGKYVQRILADRLSGA
jgi:riboflavin synthase